MIPGMELTTEEEVHVICLFASLEGALAFDALVYDRLMPVPNREDIFGKQQIMNEEDEVIGTKEYLLINAASISFDEVFSLVQVLWRHRLSGTRGQNFYQPALQSRLRAARKHIQVRGISRFRQSAPDQKRPPLFRDMQCNLLFRRTLSGRYP